MTTVSTMPLTKPNGVTYDANAYRMALVFLVQPIVSGHGSKQERVDLPSWEEEKNASRFPFLNRRGSKAGRYTIKASSTPDDLSEEQFEEWQDRLTMQRQFAALAGISMSATDYGKSLSVRGKSSNHGDGTGPMFDVTHTSRWDGGSYDREAAKRSEAKLALAKDRALYPWMYDARGKRRAIQIDSTGQVCFGPRGRTVTVRDLMSYQRSEDCKVACETDLMARTIRQAAHARQCPKAIEQSELDALIAEQAADLKAQRKGRAYGLSVSIGEMVSLDETVG